MNHTKYSDLANFIPHDAEHLGTSIADSLNDQRKDPELNILLLPLRQARLKPIVYVGLNSCADTRTII